MKGHTFDLNRNLIHIVIDTLTPVLTESQETSGNLILR
jgi:hypothetical protein